MRLISLGHAEVWTPGAAARTRTGFGHHAPGDRHNRHLDTGPALAHFQGRGITWGRHLLQFLGKLLAFAVFAWMADLLARAATYLRRDMSDPLRTAPPAPAHG